MIFSKTNKMDKRGDAPLGLMIVVTLGLVVYTLIGFSSFNNKDLENSQNISAMINSLDFSYHYVIASSEIMAQQVITDAELTSSKTAQTNSDLKSKFQEVASSRDLRVDEFGNFYGKIRSGDFKFDKKGDRYLLSFNALSVNSEKGANKMTRNFNLTIEFDSQGNIISVAQGL